VALKSKSSTVSSLDNEISKQDTPQRHAGDEWHADIDDCSQFVRSGMKSSATASLEGSTSESSSTPLQECVSGIPASVIAASLHHRLPESLRQHLGRLKLCMEVIGYGNSLVAASSTSVAPMGLLP
jgi:hypothetical protein